MYTVVLLKSRRLIIVPPKWLQNTAVQRLTRVFFSPNNCALAKFDLDVEYLFNKDKDNTYEGFVLKHFNTFNEAEQYIDNKRPVFPVDYSQENYDTGNIQPNMRAQ